MNFQHIPPLEKPKEMMDAAFGAGRLKVAGIKKGKAKRMEFDKLQKEKVITRIRAVRSVLVKRLRETVKSFPSMNELTEFYTELSKCFLDIGMMRKCLGGVSWAAKRVELLSRSYIEKAKRNRDNTKWAGLQKGYLGRVASTLKQIKEELAYLEECRKVLRKFPRVKNEFTACIAGFPNVGKSTLLKKLSGTKPEIASYAFTTKRLNVAYIKTPYGKIQLVDTPGTLNRFDKMNDIERQAHLALKHLASVIVYVYDLTEPFPLKDQEKFFKQVKKMDKPLLIYVSKQDLIPEQVEGFCAEREAVFSPKDIKQSLLKLEKAYRKKEAKGEVS